MLKRRALFVASVLLQACLSNTVSLEPEAESVAIVRETERPIHCRVLGRINGTSKNSDEKLARTGAENDFRNQAAKLKGNFALLEAERGGHVGTSTQQSYFIGGKALFCQTEAMEEEREKAEAKAREQKEQKEQEEAALEEKEREEKAERKKKKDKE